MIPFINRQALIIEPHASGHHGEYLRWLIAACRESSIGVTLGTTKEALAHPSLKILMREYQEIPTIVAETPPAVANKGWLGLVQREIRYRALFQEIYRQALISFVPEVVIVPFIDYCAYALAILGPPFGDTPWIAIAMRPSFHFEAVGVRAPSGRLDRIKGVLFLRLMQNRSLRSMLVIDPTLCKTLCERGGVIADRVQFLPDPADAEDASGGSRSAMRHALGISEERIVLLVTGALSRRKGIDLLLLLLSQDKVPQNLDVIAAGVQDAEVSEAVERFLLAQPRWQKRVHIINRFLSPEERHDVLAASDIVWLLYEGHYGMSGILVTAGRAGLPVLASDEGLVGWWTARYSLGLVADRREPELVRSALFRLVEDAELRKELGKNGARAFSRHTVNEAKKTVGNVLIGFKGTK